VTTAAAWTPAVHVRPAAAGRQLQQQAQGCVYRFVLLKAAAGVVSVLGLVYYKFKKYKMSKDGVDQRGYVCASQQ
jgi:hypothetical protein